MLQCVLQLCCSVLHVGAVECVCGVFSRFSGPGIHSVLQCVAACCSVLQCIAMWCSLLHCVAVMLQRVAVMLQRDAAMLQYVAVMLQCFTCLGCGVCRSHVLSIPWAC